MFKISLPKIKSLRKKLLSWYDRYARDLPWRRTKDPYKIWVSEIMLQQTQVDTVIPYYQKWTKAFPDIRSLAEAPLENILKHWAGLGYYRRARMLHKAAAELVKTNRGRLPGHVEDLMKIPGIGRYTAGAISSIAFNQQAPLVDGNVIRILSRIFEIRDDITLPETLKTIWGLSESLVDPKRPGDFNQAMMELGATVCTPDLPQCLICPVQQECAAYKKGCQSELPVKLKRDKLQKVKSTALVLSNHQNKILIEQQPQDARWGGLWMFPVRQSPKSIEADFGVKLNGGQARINIKHGFTKYQIEMTVYMNKISGKSPVKIKKTLPVVKECSQPPYESSKTAKSKWIPLKSLVDFAFPSHHRKIAEYLIKTNGNGHLT